MATRMRFLIIAVLSLNSFVLGQSDPDQIQYVTAELMMLPEMENIVTYRLAVEGPDNYYFEREFRGDDVPYIDSFDLHGDLLPDGIYAYEMTLVPKISEEAKEVIRLAQVTGDMRGVEELRKNGQIPASLEPVFGNFAIKEGLILFPGGEERRVVEDEVMDHGAMLGSDGHKRDQIIADDLIVDGKACVGLDCSDGEAFGFATILLKERYLQIRFDDTSRRGFTRNDWQLRANNRGYIGNSAFFIEDLSHGTSPFVVQSGAENNSLYVSDDNQVGFGTSMPRANIHFKTENWPSILLEQDGSVPGYRPNHWGLYFRGEEFRLSPNNNKIPFRVSAGAEANSLVISENGNIGISQDQPEVKLDLWDDQDATIRTRPLYSYSQALPQFHAKFTGRVNQRREMLVLENRGEPTIRFSNSDPGQPDEWSMTLLSNDTFLISNNRSDVPEMEIFNDGNVTIAGTLTESSDVNLKENFETVEALDVLDRVTDLPITTWNYRRDNDTVRHMGPTAQDFAAAFGLGNTNVGISNVDSTGVMFAALKGLNLRLDEKEAELSHKDNAILLLKKGNAELAQRLKVLQKKHTEKLQALAQDREARLKALEDKIQKINRRSN